MYTLMPYQKSDVAATLSHFRRSRDLALVVLPTGAGKSLVIAELARLAKGRVLVLTHVKGLESYFSRLKQAPKRLFTGTDDTVTISQPSRFTDFRKSFQLFQS